MSIFQSSDIPPPKCYVTTGYLPKELDLKHLPSKKKPFSTILGQPFSHTVDLLLPAELYDVIWKDLKQRIKLSMYSRVIVSLSGLLDGDFFNSYIKSGNIAMLSEGRPGIDNLYSLRDGVLRLELPKEVYERVGLVGKPIRDGGRKHLKTRYAIEINLRLPSMLHGKKGFERIVWAFKNVLNSAVTWLFYDFDEKDNNSETLEAKAPVSKHHPIVKVCVPTTTRTEVVIPSEDFMTPYHTSSPDFDEDSHNLVEWLGMIILESPRVSPNDTIDPYLCRYAVPGSDPQIESQIVRIRWQGFLPEVWIRTLFVECTQSARTSIGSWFALSAHAFRTEAIDGRDGYTVLRFSAKQPDIQMEADSQEVSEASIPAKEYIIWEMSADYASRT